MGVGKWGRRPWVLKLLAKKGCFLSFQWKKTYFTAFDPPGKILEKSPSAPPLEKILPTPMSNL